MNILENFNDEQLKVLKKIKDVCMVNNVQAYIVGGAVRDSILKKSIKDIDICVNKDPKLFIYQIDEVKKVKYYDDFQTSNIVFNNNVEVDLIRCRKEVYTFDGDVPKIIPSDLYNDLYRRDFTINSIAYNLISNKIIDPYKGIEDLKKCILKKVHYNSYVEDPTRIFRGIKYSTRYNLTLYDKEEILNNIKNDVFCTISKDRIMKEIVLLCKEEKWEKNILYLYNLKIDNLNFNVLGKKNILGDYNDINIRLLNVFISLKSRFFKDIFINNSILDKELKYAIKHYDKCKNNIFNLLSNTIDNYKIYKILNNISHYEKILLCWNEYIVYKVINYDCNLVNMKLDINGKDILKLGIHEGKLIGDILEHLLKLKLNTGAIKEKTYLVQNIGEIIDGFKNKNS